MNHPDPTEEERAKMHSCVGCTENFYNGNNQYGVKVCWSLPTAQLEKRFKISLDAPMHRRSNYQEVEAYQCRREKGYVLVNEQAYNRNATED